MAESAVSDESSEQLDDKELVVAFLDGDRGAFEQLVLRHQDRVFGLCFRLLGSRQAAEEAAQEVFVKVFKNLDRFRGDSRFSTWLYRVTINHTRNVHGHRTRRRERDHLSIDAASSDEEGTSSPLHLSDSSRSAEEELIADERIQQLREELAMLDPLWQEILVLRDVEGLSYEDTAAALSVAPGTVKSRLHRARTELRKRMLRRAKREQERG
jgi:RNA polymerase sigma-70 factor, ECF subfamily